MIDIVSMRKRHRKGEPPAALNYCTACGMFSGWPCDATRALDELEGALREIRGLRALFITKDRA